MRSSSWASMRPNGCRAFNTLVVLGPTASGKTTLGVQLARALNGEIVSADSRQVYRGLDIGSGKDLAEYVVDGIAVPYHLIDSVDLEEEYHLFAYQRDCFRVLADVWAREKLPVLVGGTGMYLEAVLGGYELVEAPEDPELRAELERLSGEELESRLRALKPALHNTTDLGDRARMVRAIEIAVYAQDTASRGRETVALGDEDTASRGRETMAPSRGNTSLSFDADTAGCHSLASPPGCAGSVSTGPKLQTLILGTQWPRAVLRQRIADRLRERLDHGLIEEVEQLHAHGHSWERLDRLGLEYRHVSQFLQGQYRTRGELFHHLNIAIGQFAKRQETWFRRMERRGTVIHWVEEARLDHALAIIRAQA